MKKSLIRIFIFSFLSLNIHSQTDLNAFVYEELDGFIKQGIRKWSIPGISVAIVKDGKVLYNKGFGLKSIRSKAEIDSNTQFMIGSLSKSITCTTLLLAESRGELSINDPIIKHLTDFKTKDINSSRIVDVEDFLTGKNGLNKHQGDFMFWKTNLLRSKVIEAISTFNINPIRKKFSYNNLTYMLLGEVLESATKMSWEENVHNYFFEPLKMHHSYASSKWLKNKEKIAKPHLVEGNEIIELRDENIDNMGPAGSIYSTSTDMSKWILEFLSFTNEKIESKFPKEVLRKIRKPYQLKGFRRTKDNLDQLRFLFSGLGWSISDEFGFLTYTHDGGTDGFKSELMIIPEKQFGVIVLTNSRSHQFSYALVKELQQLLYKKPLLNVSDELLANFKSENHEYEEEKIRVNNLNKVTLSKSKRTSYLGQYHNYLYGNISIEEEKSKLIINFLNHQNNLKGELIYEIDEKFIIDFEPIEFGFMNMDFIIEKGNVKGFNLNAENTGDKAYYFEKI